MKQFGEDFKSRLWETIQDIENNSLVEIVVIVKARSDEYNDVPLWYGIGLAILTFTFFLFSPFEFGTLMIYVDTIFALMVGYLLALWLKPLQRLFLSKSRMNRQVEIMSRAVFQKGGIRHTDEKIGVLFYVSLLERRVQIVADRGAQMAIPDDEWEQLQNELDAIFDHANPADALLAVLSGKQEMFTTYIPPVENDINELPDDLEVEL